MKTFIPYLALAFALLWDCSYDNIYSTSSQAVTAYLQDASSERPLVNFSAQINGDLFRTDTRGYFQQTIRRKENHITLTAFPYKTKILASQITLRSDTVIKLQLLPRMADYQALLQRAQRSGYALYSVQKFWEKRDILPKKYIILRHDVDYDPLTALAMAIVESQLGVHSTYYFRWSTAEASFVNAIKELGHEVGLHFETIATFARQNNLYRPEDLTPSVMNICRNRLKNEIARFEMQFGDIFSISSHGEEWNMLMKISNAELVRKQNLADFSVVLCSTFLEQDRDFVDLFVADSGNKWAPLSFKEALNKDIDRLYVLTHPVWWNADMTTMFGRRTDFIF